MFLWHFPSASHIQPNSPNLRCCLLAALPLAGILPCDARTFLTRMGATTLLPWGQCSVTRGCTRTVDKFCTSGESLVIGRFELGRREADQPGIKNSDTKSSEPAGGALSIQPQQTRSSSSKATTPIKRLELSFKIYMQLVNSPRSSLVYSLTNKFAPNSLMLNARVNGSVQ